MPLRLWIQPDGTLQYEVRMAELEAAELTYDLTLGWGTTAAANDQAVLHILMATLGMEPRREWEQAVHRDASGRVTELDCIAITRLTITICGWGNGSRSGSFIRHTCGWPGNCRPNWGS